MSHADLVVVLTTGIFPPEIGGPATYVERLARTLSRDKASVSVVTTSPDKNALHHKDPASRQEIVAITRQQSLIRRMCQSTKIIYSRARSADLVYANGIYLEAAVATALARKPLIVKVVGDYAWETAWNDSSTTTDLTTFQTEPDGSRKALVVRRLQRWWCRRAKIVIVASRYLADIVDGWGVPSSRIVVVPNAVEVPQDPPRFLDPPPSKPRIISGGRFIWWKHLDVLVRALVHAPDMTLTLLGEGPEQASLEALGQNLGVEERLQFHPPVPPGQISNVLREHDIFALPSSSDTFSYMTIEAMAAGLPVVVSNEGALPEVVGDGRWGRIVPKRDPEQWAEALSLTADPAAYRSTAEAGHAVAKSTYNWDSIYSRTIDIMREV